MSIRIDILSAVPKLLASPLSESILKIAQEKKLAEIVVHDLRTFTHDKHHTLDESPYGGGAGMILKPEPIIECIESLQAQRTYDEIIYVSADGEPFTQKIANDLSLKSNVMILCGHYKGVDERVRQTVVTREISIGDYVLTGRRTGRAGDRRRRREGDTGSDRRRGIGADGFVSGRIIGQPALHPAAGIPRNESAGRAAVGKSQRNCRMAR